MYPLGTGGFVPPAPPFALALYLISMLPAPQASSPAYWFSPNVPSVFFSSLYISPAAFALVDL